MSVNVDIYTDGSATIASKPGGYGWVLVINGQKHSEGNGHIEKGTNNDAEMEAAIRGLAAALRYVSEQSCLLYAPDYNVTLVSDSQIILGWASGKYRFKQESKYERFSVLKKLMERLKANTRWVRGHSGDEFNERCDELANEGRVGLKAPKEPKPPKKPNVMCRDFRWNQLTQKYDAVKADKDILKEFLGAPITANSGLALEALTRVVIELIEIEEARNK